MKSRTSLLIATLFYSVIAQDQTQTPIQVSTSPSNDNEAIVENANLTTISSLVLNITATSSETPSVTNDEDTDMTMTIGYSSTVGSSNSTSFQESTTAKYNATTSRPSSPPFPNNVGSWFVNGTSSPCLMLTGALQLHISSNVSNMTDISIDVPSIAGYVNVSGTCKSEEQELKLNWTSDSSLKSLTFKFAMQAKNKFVISSVQYFNNSDSEPFQLIGPLFQTSLNHSYRCTSNQRTGNDKTPNFYILMEKFQFQAFMQQRTNATSSEPSFDSSEDCSADHRIVKGVILGMVAGAALSAIVGVVLAVYLCRRYRRGYQPLNDDTVIVS